jgi:type II secretory pathway pseudopilin PulG
MTVVITVLTVIAALILPNVVAIQRSREIRTTEAALQRLPLEAREESVRSKSPVMLRLDGEDLVMERIPIGEGADGEPVEVRRIALGAGIKLGRVRQKQETVDPASWEWRIYPDGSTTPTGLEFQEGEITKSLIIEAEGGTHWESGDESEIVEEMWTAGELEVRGQTN